MKVPFKIVLESVPSLDIAMTKSVTRAKEILYDDDEDYNSYFIDFIRVTIEVDDYRGNTYYSYLFEVRLND